MRQIRIALTMLALTTAAVVPASAQTPDADCQAGRERLAGHARASEAVRKVLSARAGTAPAAGAPGAAAAPGGRAAEIRTRLGEIPRERQRVDDVRVGAMVKLDFARAAQAQGQLETLDLERRRLERELATLPQSPSAPAPSPPAAPPTGAIDADRVPCRDVATTLDAALKARRRELGAREAQAGAIPLAPLRGQTTTAVARARRAVRRLAGGGQPGGLARSGWQGPDRRGGGLAGQGRVPRHPTARRRLARRGGLRSRRRDRGRVRRDHAPPGGGDAAPLGPAARGRARHAAGGRDARGIGDGGVAAVARPPARRRVRRGGEGRVGSAGRRVREPAWRDGPGARGREPDDGRPRLA